MLGPDWRKSTRSHTNGCVEVAHNADEGTVQVRNSRDPQGPIVQFTAGQWQQEVLVPIRRSEFDDRDWAIFDPLRFTFAERVAFAAGVRNGKFDLPAEPKPLYPELADDLKRAGEQAARHKAGMA